MQRRAFLAVAAAGAAATLTACAGLSITPPPTSAATNGSAPVPTPSGSPDASPSATATAPSTPGPKGSSLLKVVRPPGPITELPGTGDLLAWTADDGADSDVIRKYVDFAVASGVRLTLFANGRFAGWTVNAAALRPLGRVS
ncbi:hypothetical protein B7R22_05870 [Subtercola boreus]|uniref:Uncharacterized protein n=1 Tax=Subtercola boreus TaxID=120213 RepID=A0A3E0W1P9_9MICO|nr:hypothetical protein [Subtercola boreus]RFA15920.1 hypothetical protein B7R22_05870 [Subtercola boreus]